MRTVVHFHWETIILLFHFFIIRRKEYSQQINCYSKTISYTIPSRYRYYSCPTEQEHHSIFIVRIRLLMSPQGAIQTQIKVCEESY